ncbi:uncharacterized protein [Lolium perenne]|uniref:uncharacterized protein n=1 Tax=Lolium perenne TaxID=4522 RepID=UPI003A9A65B0
MTFSILGVARELVHENTSHSTMSAIARLLTIKSMNNQSESAYNDTLQLIHELLPSNSSLPTNFYRSKKLLEGLGMPYHKIHVCRNNCMLYYKDNEAKLKCDICKAPRYKEGSKKVAHKVLRYMPITDRLQRLYAHEETAKMMRYHKKTPHPDDDDDMMVHPCDGEAWQQLDKDEPNFASDPRSVRLVMATDGFTPYSLTAASYSCWPVFVSPLNLPPDVITRPEYIFLALVIPGPEHPGTKLNILMQPLADELSKLWAGVRTWDAYGKQNFDMKAAQLWTIHDFPAFGMVAGWSTHGRLACYDCGSDTQAFRLDKGGKACWFDCHRRFLPLDHEFRTQADAFRKDTVVLEGPPRRLTGVEVHAQAKMRVVDGLYGKEHNWNHVSCFWELPYFEKLLLRHTIDVMHNEKNVSESIWSTCFDIPDRTKDNVKARQDLELICNRTKLHLKPMPNGKWEKPRAPFCIEGKHKVIILNWFKSLRFPDGYAASFRRGVNMKDKKIFGLKSHDYHIFIERLLPAAFRGFLPEDIWVCLSELSFFYRQLCAKQLSKATVANLEKNIVVLICKLEKIFPPGFFNPMQHLMIHLPRQARLAGPVQNIWMYRYERYI